MARPGRGHCTPSHRHGIPNVIPLPWAPSPTPGEPKTRHSLITPGIPAPPLSGPSADGLSFPGAGYCMAHDTRKRRSNGDEPVGGTIPRLVEGSDGGYPAGNLRPHQLGPCRHQPGTETGDQEDPRPPTTHTQPPIQILPLQHPFLMQSPYPPPDLTRQVVTPTERWVAELQSLL